MLSVFWVTILREIYIAFLLCRALFTSLCVILVEQNEHGPRKFMYLLCVFTPSLRQRHRPFSSLPLDHFLVGLPLLHFFAFSPFFLSHGHSRPDDPEVAADSLRSSLLSSFIDSCMGPHLYCKLCELPTTDLLLTL